MPLPVTSPSTICTADRVSPGTLAGAIYNAPTVATQEGMTISADHDAIVVAKAAATAIAEKKGLSIALLDVSELVVLTDVFVIATGTSNRHVKTLVEETEHQLETSVDHPRRPLRREGEDFARWVLLDYGDVVIHVFDEETRAYYDLERLWADAPRIAFEPVPTEA